MLGPAAAVASGPAVTTGPVADLGDLHVVVGGATRLVDEAKGGEGHVVEVEVLAEGVEDRPEPLVGPPVGAGLVVGLECLAHLIERELHLAGPQVGHGGDPSDAHRLAGGPFELVEQPSPPRFHQGDGHPLAAGAAHPADAVHVGLRRARDVEVHHVAEVLHVEAACRHVGGDEQVRRARAETAHHPVALLLVHPAVQRLGPVAAGIERLREFVHLPTGAAEHQGGGG